MKASSPVQTPRRLYLGVKGSVVALDADTGRQLWATHLKGSDFVHVVLEGDNLYATTRGEVFCLDPGTGDGRWHNPLKGFGYGLVSVACAGAPMDWLALAAESQERERRSSDTASSSSTT